MKSPICSFAVALFCLLPAADPETQARAATPSAVPWRLLFSGSQDIADTWGLLHFGVTPVRVIRECEPPGFTVIGCFPLSDGRWEEAYVMVAVLDEKGQTIPGFESDKCTIRNEDRGDIPLIWGNLSARQLAGQAIRLRVFLRGANIYAVTARDAHP